MHICMYRLFVAKPIQKGSSYPAQEFCSHCGLCDTYYVAHVKDACAFLGDGEQQEGGCSWRGAEGGGVGCCLGRGGATFLVWG